MTQINKASDLALLLTTMLSQITQANGYNTDIGLQVYRGKRNIEDEQPPCAVLIEGLDKMLDQGPSQVNVEQDYAAVAYMPCDPDNPNDAAHLAIKDIKKLFFAAGPRLDNRVKKITYKGKEIGPRMDGAPIVMAVVHLTIQFAETLADA